LRCRGWAIENETVLDRAEILAKASAILGSQQGAERWLQTPATGLNRQRPIDLLATRAGAEIVENFLSQLEYGVYL
jgi:putative toxin-antitoxin system antitoxin component (TIGR02293 family)